MWNLIEHPISSGNAESLAVSQQVQLQTRMYAITNVEKSEIGIEVMLMDNNKLVGKQVIPNERL